jgi:signal transduction histidine kinase
MRRFFDLSFRHKIPLWGGALIVVSAVAVSGGLMFRAYEHLKQDLVISSESLGYTLANTLFPVLLHDDAWRAFELVRAPFHEDRPEQPLEPKAIFVVDRNLKVLVSSAPRSMPLLAELGSLGADHQQLAHALAAADPDVAGVYEFPGSDHLYVTIPVAEKDEHLGTLVVTHAKQVFLPRFYGFALGGAGMGALVLAILLPLNWYWGRRMAEPLVQLAHGMSEIVHGAPADLSPKLYAFSDELGQLFNAYREAAAEIRKKTALEREVMQSERLAAVGRLAAGIAHEVNNPLGGMLMALDTLKQRGPLDPATARTVALVERGLQQITETVGALLVQARVQARTLNRQDFEDIRTLVEPQATGKSLQLDFAIDTAASLPLPSGFVRQVLINLLLNAIEATPPGGLVRVTAYEDDSQLTLVVANSGEPPSAEILAHLFEPFVSGREGGHGLGLWVSYQTVKQLGGRIAVECRDGEVRFLINLPLQREVSAHPAKVGAGATALETENPT